MDNPDLAQYLQEINKLSTTTSVEEFRMRLFGRQGILTTKMKALTSLEIVAKKEQGRYLNILKEKLQAVLTLKQEALVLLEMEENLKNEALDVTLPVQNKSLGKLHPISNTIEQIIAIFGNLGFVVKSGPDIEDDWHNFTALNIPQYHPARQEHDTFYLNAKDDLGLRKVLRTHTSTVQIREMSKQELPLRIIVPGKTYRNDYDATHSPMFHQVEGLYIDKFVNIPQLKGVLYNFCQEFFGLKNLSLRVRPSYFPFTEPSFEFDVACAKKNGQLIIGEGESWLEILGCGMVHPKVIVNCGLSPELYRGFAFGIGIERIAMLKYGFSDLRAFFENDVRWLEHYGFDFLKIPNLVWGLN